MTEAQQRIVINSVLAAVALAVLVFMLIPGVGSGPASPRTACRDNLHNIGIALLNYHDVKGSFPPAYSSDDRGRPMHSWRVYALPYVDQAPLYNHYSLDEPWNGPNNASLAESVGSLPVYQCPTDAEEWDTEQPWTSYVAVVGPHTAWPDDQPARIMDFTDGAANTLLLVESHNTGIHWMEPRDLHVTQMATTVNPQFGQGISSPHDGVVNVLFADGNARFLSDSIDPETLRRLIERDGGEEPSGF